MKYIIILSHQGGSFVGKLSQAAEKLCLKSIVLSSRSDADKWEKLLAITPYAYQAAESNLTFETVVSLINENDIDTDNIKGFISVWEGYRPLMASLNEHYGFKDISRDTAKTLRDKLKVRSRLKERGLSSVSIDLADEKTISKRLGQAERSFIKPRFGLGSVGAKELKGQNDLYYMSYIKSELESDKLLGEAVSGNEFIIEDFVEGPELSAEVVIEGGDLQILALHEKTETHHGLFTTTEPFCVSPPITELDENCFRRWLNAVFSSFNLTYGCYHVELKIKTKNDFEIIEINPRAGGALIVESTNHVANTDILARWIASLSDTKDPYNIPINKKSNALSKDLASDQEHILCSAFRVYFSQMKGRVESLKLSSCSPPPSSYDILVKLGQELSMEGAEQYLGQALWTSPANSAQQAHNFFDKVQKVSKSLLHVEIRPKEVKESVFLVIDYNLSRSDEVMSIAEKCHSILGVRTVLLTTKGKSINHDFIINSEFEDLRSKSFIFEGVEFLKRNKLHCTGGVVFSDDAIITGSYILDHFGVWTDDPELSLNSHDKWEYRESESKEKLPEGVSRPVYLNAHELNDSSFKEQETWVIKPRCEGNNRGVVKANKIDHLGLALSLNKSHMGQGLIAEQCIKASEEFSVDGVGELSFITKKLSTGGLYPLEIGQVLPAYLTEEKLRKVTEASSLANKLTGQYIGAFHNEIMICSETGNAYVVEPNRRPGGMKIWELIKNSYDVDLYDKWIYSATTGEVASLYSPPPKRRSGLLMLPGPIGKHLGHTVVLSALDKLVGAVWDELEVPVNSRPKHSRPNFLVNDGHAFSHQPIDGHGFMMTISFQCELEIHLESLLKDFYEMWCRETLDSWDDLVSNKILG
ncbi:ATP-grasp domain-containing protein [Halomonas faecis]|uniref:ATP-grasp domain-containing protein n=1 Tax=Halomonas faecis TaxID=1562110 RepID=UPI0013D0238D|nr:ATP-grasp domain-containing protein [Halomonas faecis]